MSSNQLEVSEWFLKKVDKVLKLLGADITSVKLLKLASWLLNLQTIRTQVRTPRRITSKKLRKLDFLITYDKVRKEHNSGEGLTSVSIMSMSC